MDLKNVSPNLSVSGQITTADIKDIAAAGVRALICNRPDGEGADQPDFAVIEAAAKGAGLVARHIPIVPGQITDEDVAAFGAALRELPGPILAYCGSGARASALWSMTSEAATK